MADRYSETAYWLEFTEKIKSHNLLKGADIRVRNKRDIYINGHLNPRQMKVIANFVEQAESRRKNLIRKEQSLQAQNGR